MSEIPETFWNGRLAKPKGEEAMSAKSQVVSMGGVFLAIIQGLSKEVQKLGGGDEDLRRLTSPEGESLLTELAQKLVKGMSGLLKRVTTVKVQGSKKFVVKDHINSANIGWMGDNFRKLFLDVVEENVPDASLGVNSLQKGSPDAPILTELGERAMTQIAHFLTLLEKQSQGQKGDLLVNSYVNIAYIIGNDGNVWAVHAYWDPDNGYWGVDARSVGSPDAWNAGRQVLSRD